MLTLAKKIQTAGKGLPMHKMGTTHSFSLEIEGIRKCFIITVTVIEELSDDMNAGSTFLQWVGKYTGNKPHLTFHEKGVSLHIGEDKAELINTVKPGSELGLDPQRGRTKEPNMGHQFEESISHR